jgi:hypothetical protein
MKSAMCVLFLLGASLLGAEPRQASAKDMGGATRPNAPAAASQDNAPVPVPEMTEAGLAVQAVALFTSPSRGTD